MEPPSQSFLNFLWSDEQADPPPVVVNPKPLLPAAPNSQELTPEQLTLIQAKRQAALELKAQKQREKELSNLTKPKEPPVKFPPKRPLPTKISFEESDSPTIFVSPPKHQKVDFEEFRDSPIFTQKSNSHLSVFSSPKGRIKVEGEDKYKPLANDILDTVIENSTKTNIKKKRPEPTRSDSGDGQWISPSKKQKTIQKENTMDIEKEVFSEESPSKTKQKKQQIIKVEEHVVEVKFNPFDGDKDLNGEWQQAHSSALIPTKFNNFFIGKIPRYIENECHVVEEKNFKPFSTGILKYEKVFFGAVWAGDNTNYRLSTRTLDIQTPVLGFFFCEEIEDGVYFLPMGDNEERWKFMKKFIESDVVKITFHFQNVLRPLIQKFENGNLPLLPCNIMDTMIASWIIDSEWKEYKFIDIVHHFLNKVADTSISSNVEHLIKDTVYAEMMATQANTKYEN